MRFVENDTRTLTSSNQEAHTSVTIADIWEAYKLLKPLLHHTPLAPSRTLRDITGADIYLKAENMQRSGSFKVRGASYKISRLSKEEYSRGVIAASAGNHAQGVAIAAACVPAKVEYFMSNFSGCGVLIMYGIGECGLEDNQPCCGIVVDNIRAGGGTHVHPGEIAAILLFSFEALFNFLKYSIVVVLVSAILR